MSAELLSAVADHVAERFTLLSEKSSPAAARGWLAYRAVYYFSDAKSDPRIIDKLAVTGNQRRK
jgi:hypothetical protein